MRGPHAVLALVVLACVWASAPHGGAFAASVRSARLASQERRHMALAKCPCIEDEGPCHCRTHTCGCEPCPCAVQAEDCGSEGCGTDDLAKQYNEPEYDQSVKGQQRLYPHPVAFTPSQNNATVTPKQKAGDAVDIVSEQRTKYREVAGSNQQLQQTIQSLQEQVKSLTTQLQEAREKHTQTTEKNAKDAEIQKKAAALEKTNKAEEQSSKQQESAEKDAVKLEEKTKAYFRQQRDQEQAQKVAQTKEDTTKRIQLEQQIKTDQAQESANKKATQAAAAQAAMHSVQAVGKESEVKKTQEEFEKLHQDLLQKWPPKPSNATSASKTK